jgi:hypothetical protein
MADIIITPASSIMSFTSSLNYTQTLTQEASGSLTLLGSGSTGRTDLFTVNGNNGTLFSVSDDLSNSLFSVNTIAGLPVIEAFANNTVVMGQYGQNVLVVTGSNVGIGTATPQAKLSVTGTSGAFNDVGIFQITSGTGASANLKLTFGVNDSGYTWIQSVLPGTDIRPLLINPAGGNIGIGTTSPSYRLHVNTSAANADIIGATNGTQNLTLGVNNSAGGSFLFENGNNALRFGTNGSERIRITNDGNVCIGTTSSFYKFHIIAPTIGGTSYPAAFQASNFYGNELLVRVSDGLVDLLATYETSAVDTDLSFTPTTSGGSQTEAMRIQASTGNVGIGTSSPATKLDVNGGIKATTIQLTSGASDGYVLTSDSTGNGSWQAASGGGGGIHVLIPPRSGQGYGLATSVNFGNQAYSPGGQLLQWFPFIPANTLTIDRITLYVSNAATSGVAVFTIYSNLNGMPDRKLFASSNVDCSTTGYKTITTTQTFTAGEVYWFGLNMNDGNIQFYAMPSAASYSFAWTNGTGTIFNANSCAYLYTTSPGSEPSTVDQTAVNFTFNTLLNIILRSA